MDCITDSRGEVHEPKKDFIWSLYCVKESCATNPRLAGNLILAVVLLFVDMDISTKDMLRMVQGKLNFVVGLLAKALTQKSKSPNKDVCKGAAKLLLQLR